MEPKAQIPPEPSQEADDLSHLLGLTRELVDERFRFLGFSSWDTRELTALAPLLGPRRAEFIERLYDHFRRYEEPASLLTSEELVERLRQAQERYFDELLAGEYGWDYVRSRLSIGRTHHRIGLRPNWYLGAYCFYLVDHIDEIAHALDAENAGRSIAAFLKIIFFDAGLTLDAYGLSEDRATLAQTEKAPSAAAAVPRPAALDPAPPTVSPISIAYTEGDIAVRRAFLQLGAEDVGELRRVGSRIVPHLPEIVDRFYNTMEQRPILARLLADPGVVERLRGAQIDYWERFFLKDLDRAYAASRLRIGRTHQRVGLDTPWYLAGFAFYLASFIEILMVEEEQPLAAIRALIKRTFFDISFVLDAYLDARREALLRDLGYAAPLLGQIHTGVSVLDTQLRVVSANRAFLRLFRLDGELLRGTHIRNALPMVQVETWARQVVQGGEETVEALVEIGAGRRPQTLRVSVLALPSTAAYAGRVAVVADDVSELIRWGQATSLSEARHQALVDGLDGVVWEVDPATWTLNLVGGQTLALTGLSETEWLETPNLWLKHLPKADRDVWVRGCEELEAEGDTLDIEHRLRRGDGKTIWVASKARLAFDRDQRPVLRGLTVDVSERVRARHEIQEKNARLGRYAAALRRVSQLGLDLSFANTRDEVLEVMRGALPGLLEARQIELAIHQPDGRTVRSLLGEDGATASASAILKTHEGSRAVPRTRPSEAGESLTPISAGGKVLGFLTLRGLRSMTEENTALQTQVAALLGAALTRVEHLEAQETARRRAEAANRIKDDFIAAMSHEIRTPMNAILGMASLLGASPLDASQQESLTALQTAGESLHALLNDLLDLSLLEKNLLDIHPAPVEFQPFVRGLAGLFEARVDEKGLAMDVKIGERLPRFVRMDPVRVRQIVVHLLSNAVKFTEEGELELACERRGNGSSFELVIRVTDTGIGIAAENLERIFAGFERVDQGRRGAGLGLTIAHRLARLMGGQLEVESEVGTGTVCVLTVPAVVVSKQEARPVSSARPLPKRVLIVEDDPLSRLVAVRIAEHLGITPEAVSSGEEALELLEKTSFPVILMDGRLPGIDGLETTRRIRRKKGDPPWVIGVSAHALQSDRLAFINSGMDDFVPKPITLETIEEALARRA